jgi:small subunit ribosomal protein S2e
MKMEEICLFLLIKESDIIGFSLAFASLKDEVLKAMPVQMQTQSVQRTRFKGFVAIGD